MTDGIAFHDAFAVNGSVGRVAKIRPVAAGPCVC